MQHVICTHLEDCLTKDYPTLEKLKEISSTCPVTWLTIQLHDFSEYCGTKNKLTSNQIEQCAKFIANEFFRYKVSELMLFFYQYKAGKFSEEFYGNIDPITIIRVLRSRFIPYIENKKQQCKLNDSTKSKGITYLEYIKLKSKREKTKK